MTLWIGNGAFLKSSSQWQNKRILKINNSWPKLSNFQTIAAFDLVYSLASTNINQSAPNLVTMYMSIRSQMSLGQVLPDQSVLSALEIEKINFSSLFGIYLLC